jgi:hypothetical protein
MEGKAVHGVSDAALIQLIEDTGGGTADGGPWNGDALNADGPSFDRAAELAFGEREPETATERAALGRFKLGGESP